MESVVQLKGLSKKYGQVSVISGVDLEIESGEHILLTGPSGAGKSTILRLIAGLEVPSAGEVALSGHVASTEEGISTPPNKRDLAMVFQDLGLWPNLTVAANIRLALSGQSLTKSEGKERVAKAVSDCALTGLERRKPGKLSAGEQQRLALARALAAEPKILLLDEPFAALDLLLRDELFTLIKNLVKERSMTVITVSHQPSDAIGLEVDRVVVMEQGGIAEQLSGTDMNVASVKSKTLQAWQRQLTVFSDQERG